MLLKKEILENNRTLKEKNKELKEEIERLMSLWEFDRVSWNELMAEKETEIERLNNIINELEKYINYKIEQCYNEGSNVGEFYKICDINEKLQELKGVDKE